MRDGKDGVVAEFLANDTLHDFIGFGVDANYLVSAHIQYEWMDNFDLLARSFVKD